MAEGDIAEIVGGLSKLVGLGTIIYGLVTQNIESIAGGAALVYAGKTISPNYSELNRTAAELQRNRLLKELSTKLDSKLKRQGEKGEQ